MYGHLAWCKSKNVSGSSFLGHRMRMTESNLLPPPLLFLVSQVHISSGRWWMWTWTGTSFQVVVFEPAIFSLVVEQTFQPARQLPSTRPRPRSKYEIILQFPFSCVSGPHSLFLLARPSSSALCIHLFYHHHLSFDLPSPGTSPGRVVSWYFKLFTSTNSTLSMKTSSFLCPLVLTVTFVSIDLSILLSNEIAGLISVNGFLHEVLEEGLFVVW